MRTALITTALAALLAGGDAFARTGRPEDNALAHMTRRADLVALARAAAEPGALAVAEVIRGTAAAGDTVRVRLPEDGEAPPADVLLLVFLTRRGEEYEPVAGPGSLLVVAAEGPSTRVVDAVRRLAATLPGDGRPDDPRARLAILLEHMADADPGFRHSGAADFVASPDLHPLLDAEGRGRILAAFRACPAGKADKERLALAVGLARPEGAAEALLDALGTGGGSLDGAVADGLVRLGDPRTPALAAARLEAEGDAPRAALLRVLGATAGAESFALLRRRVADGPEAERVEAAHALGLAARRVREAEPGTAVGGRTELVGLLAVARTENGLEAALWGLAQLEDPDAWAVLESLAEEDPRPFVRRHARLYRDRPRLSLILD